MNKVFRISPTGALRGQIQVPGDKSISHRSIMFSSLAEGVSHITGFLEGEDAIATLEAFRSMGVDIQGPKDGVVKVQGVGLYGLQAPPGPLYLGNSGTTMRLLAGLMSGQSFDTQLTGDASLSKRPMKRVADPLTSMGAKIKTTDEGTPPLYIYGGQTLKGIDYLMPIASAQVKSCLLLAGLYAQKQTCVMERAVTRDHTERMLQGFGYAVKRSGMRVCVTGGGRLHGRNIAIPGDISSATFPMVAAAITPGSDVTIENVGVNPTRVGVINILRMMGADISLGEVHEIAGEPVTSLRIRHAPLKGITIPKDQVSLAIDEFPALFIAAAHATGTTVLSGAAELRVKESDRIQCMADGLKILGIPCEVQSDGLVVHGGSRIQGGRVNGQGDHRVAMAFAIAGINSDAEVIVDDCENVNTSFPNFIRLMSSLGMQIVEDTL